MHTDSAPFLDQTQKKKADGPTEPQQLAKKHRLAPSSESGIGQVTTAEDVTKPYVTSDSLPLAPLAKGDMDPDKLREEISAQGLKVRDLKSSGADKVMKLYLNPWGLYVNLDYLLQLLLYTCNIHLNLVFTLNFP